MRTRSTARAAVTVPVALAAAVIVAAPALAQARPATDIDARTDAPCEVTFGIDNRTNAVTYTVDFRVDGEPLTGPDFGSGPIGHTTVRSEVAPGTPVFQPGVVGYRFDLESFRSERTEDLIARGYPPKPPSESYYVEYRMILGPDANDRHPEWRAIEVPGCQESGSSGSSVSSGSSLFHLHDLLGIS